MAVPVVISENGYGTPVLAVDANAPEMVVAENGLGIPIVLSDLGAPFVVTGASPFSPLSLFANGEQGAWFDAGDLGSMFQDAAGAIPAVVGQPVGLILDKSGNANHASQATATARPTLMQDVEGRAYLHFDRVDDVLATTFPAAVTGDLLIAGRDGSWIEPVSILAGGTMNIGPTGTPATPNILGAVGDIVGWTVIDKTLSEAERTALMGYYRDKGAKGLLVPGPELVTPSWALKDPSVSYSGGVFSFAGTPPMVAAQNNEGRPGYTVIGSYYEVTFEIFDYVSGGVRFGVNGAAWSTLTRSGNGVFKQIIAASWTGRSVNIVTMATSTLKIRAFSVRELRPQEDWS